MADLLALQLAWTLVKECPPPESVNEVLVGGEQVVCAYKTFRDTAVITNKRLLIADAQGLTGKKVEVYTIPWSSVNMWSSENSKGLLDFNSELEFWTKAGHFKLNLKKGIDIRRLDRVIGECILGTD